MIDIKNLSYSFGLRTLLKGADLFVARGQKIGLVGVNGCGKTTLFNLILGKLAPENGSININSDVTISTVKQEIENTDLPLMDFILNADARVKKLQDELNKTHDGRRIAEIHDELNRLGVHSAAARAAAILSGLGFTQTDFNKPLKEFSGGWRVRAALAATLFSPSEILLLDEPTNHLDLETSIWLENYLEKLDRTIIIISHDRGILNKLCERIVLMDEQKLKSYNGNYDTFEKTREIEKENAQAAAKQHEIKRAHLQSFVDRFRYKASKAAQAQSRLKMLEKMGDAPPVPVDAQVQFIFPQPDSLPPYLITIEDGQAGYVTGGDYDYGEKIVLKDLNITLSQDDKIALLGANGNGKSTLAKVLAARLPLLRGKTKKSRKLRVAYFAQHQTEEFDLDKTAFEIMSEAFGFVPSLKVYTHLGGFGLNKNKADTKIAKLSGGEKARLMLALITKDKPHVLILDEPTNHLDIVSRSALVEALNEYEGAVILITHDLHMISLVCDRLWYVGNGGVHHFNGDTEDYRQKILNGTFEAAPAAPDPSLPPEEQNRETRRRLEAQKRLETAPLKKELKDLERALSEMQADRGRLEEELIKKFEQQKSKELAYKIKDIEKAEARWLELSSKIEKLSA
ncbi:MAG: ABC-F family ATP-binding cassette domain-containing protein [Elusimicrobium sp.]|jgi:ATP-binding cassette subfamily F protein 3|nr:ABC-F family ATP-binding cassette domain-containing protein [Elusimicrobium sp.]